MKAVEIIMIPVADQQRAKAFYLKLGFELLMEAPSEHGETWIQMRLPGQNVTSHWQNSMELSSRLKTS